MQVLTIAALLRPTTISVRSSRRLVTVLITVLAATITTGCAEPTTAPMPPAIEVPLGQDSVETALAVLKQPTQAYAHDVRGKIRFIHERDPDFVSKLTAALDDADWRRQAKLIAILGSVGPAAQSAVPRIVRADSEMRRSMLKAGFQEANLPKGMMGVTADALANIGGADTRAILERLLREGSPGEAVGAADALFQMGGNARSLAPALLERGKNSATVQDSIQVAHVAVGVDPDVIAASRDIDFWRRRIFEATRDADANLAIRASQLLPLARVSAKDGMPIVISLASRHVNDEANWYILALAEVTARYGADGIAYVTRSATTAPDERTRCASLLLLSAPGVASPTQVNDVAMQALRDPEASVRIAAMNALAEQGARSAAVEIERMTSDSDERVRSAAKAALQRIAEGESGDRH